MSATRRLIVNADDFGFTRDVNDGIVAAHRQGILTATTVMANGAAFGHAVELARGTPDLDVGCHLVLVGGESLDRPGTPLPATVVEMIRALAARRLRVEAELERQIARILEAGLRPVHLDTHKHTHLWPPVLTAVAKLSEKYGIRWVRRPFDLPRTGAGMPWVVRLTSRGLDVMRRRFHKVLDRHGCRTTDHFAGFQLTGRFAGADLEPLLGALPEGLTELMTHPGYCRDELRAARTRLKESRERELEALCAAGTRRALERAGVELTRYSLQ